MFVQPTEPPINSSYRDLLPRSAASSSFYAGSQSSPNGAARHLMRMRALTKSWALRVSTSWRLCALLLVCLGTVRHVHAAATLLLEEPYSYDGAFAGTGHVAVYLSNVCSSSPVVLRPCADGEAGVVLSRYDGIAGYDWIAIPLIPYLYAVDKPEDVPLFADAKLVAFLRDQYRRDYLESVAPDRAEGRTPEGNWYELVGSSYDRTIYGFEIETTPEQDARLISKFNREPNIEHYNLVKRNCADFVREVIDFYHPRALHRSIIGDLGVTTPKQIAKMMIRYGHHHPELEGPAFLLPQVPGTVRRSKPIHGVLESVMTAKKYMLPIVVLHPYIGGGLLVEYFGHRRFDPSRNVLIMASDRRLSAPMSHDQRLALQSRMEELSHDALLDASRIDASHERKAKDVRLWERLQASAQLGIDASGQPILRVQSGDDVALVGLTRANIQSASQSSELAARLMEARLGQELSTSSYRKTSPKDVEKDLTLFRQLLAQPRVVAAKPPSTTAGSATARLQ